MEHRNNLKNTLKKTSLKPLDFLLTGEEFELLFDEARDMLVTHPEPTQASLSKYYQSDGYISHTDQKKGIVAYLYQCIKKHSLSNKHRLITNLNKGEGRLLDIGAGTGDFLKIAKNKGWQIDGVEPDLGARALAAAKQVSLRSSIDDVVNETFDVVSLWHVLEHMSNLDETIKRIESFVRPGGYLIIAVPNFRSFDAKHYGSFWAAFDVPRHLWHFSRRSLERIVSGQFNLIKTKPMVFDSFYVSLLSEKYKSGNSFSILALMIGLWSNVLAWRSKEYSSVIYCFKKEV